MNGTDPQTFARIQQRIADLVQQTQQSGEPFFGATPADIAAEIKKEFPNVPVSVLQQAAYGLQSKSNAQGGLIPGTPAANIAGAPAAVGSALQQIPQQIAQQIAQNIQQAAQNATKNLFGNPDWGKIATIAAGLVLIVWGASIYAAPATEDFERHGEAVAGKV